MASGRLGVGRVGKMGVVRRWWDAVEIGVLPADRPIYVRPVDFDIGSETLVSDLAEWPGRDRSGGEVFILNEGRGLAKIEFQSWHVTSGTESGDEKIRQRLLTITLTK